jgi:hypothetical protein
MENLDLLVGLVVLRLALVVRRIIPDTLFAGTIRSAEPERAKTTDAQDSPRFEPKRSTTSYSPPE